MNRFRLAPAVALACVLAARLAAFDVWTATQPAAAPPIFNLLTWPHTDPAAGEPAVTRFNVYRKIDPAAPYPQFPLNAAPLAVLKDCNDVKDLIPEDSIDWELIETALADHELQIGSLAALDLQLKKLVADEKLAPGVIAKNNPDDACDVWKLAPASPEMAKLQILARARWRVALLLGQGWQDPSVIEGVTYYYRVTGLDAKGGEHVLQSDIAITAGAHAVVPAPDSIAAIAGDARVLVHWGEVPAAMGFNVYRSNTQAGPYELVNDSSLTARLVHDLDGQPIVPGAEPVDGFVDFQRWSQQGNPVSHDVAGIEIEGPTNGTRYYYRVAGVDLLGHEGPLTSSVSAQPLDTTSPAVPQEVTVIPDEKAGRIEVRWAKVSRDTAGHTEAGIDGYRVWRRSGPYSGDADLDLVSGLIPQPGKGTSLVHFFDVHSAPENKLWPDFGEKHFWYHVECIDAAGNSSAKSAGIAGTLRDIKPPATPAGVQGEGFEEHITVTWEPVVELDDEGDDTIAGYNVYRSLCDLGDWGCLNNEKYTGDLDRCPVTFDFLGFVSQADALAGGAAWEDRDIPAGSPLCYAYLVKTLDEAQNESGAKPVDLDVETIVCQRLRDRTPPRPAILSGLYARDDAIRIDWIAGPLQDLKAHHVYRSEQETGSYQFVGGLTVEIPPKLPQVLTQPYAPGLAGCEVIPLEALDGASAGSFLDSSADPKKVYFYKVLGVDQNGNESPLEDAQAMSTFTFSRQVPAAPALTVTPSAKPCGLRLAWTPAYDSRVDKGYLVLRSEQAAGPFVAVPGTIAAGSSYLDERVERGKTYHYRVARVGLDGRVSIAKTASGKLD